ncbi:hypothetical protein GP475_12020 [Corynebacterium poyangense]|uniref:DUF5318 domain-containing protein n=1 Tax=Corynebacterium poyangense TaxID=2684405 RepID=A0A7H0SRV3_9CORY|nr:DUF5318 family protein [Corynebacterium poyangense]QNQ91278.1 hypothetical protein GP475_12020 [Corynebacterium poyangense]
MLTYRDEINHLWERRHVLRQWRRGELSRESVCDADFLLITASQYHGSSAGRDCPICGSEQLRTVEWIYGEKLGRLSGTARTKEEIAELLHRFPEITVHTVEVCPVCKWNFLLKARTAVAG